ncbi:unnamed protein product [Blepharisma stoltei]|uniref:Uncharacterized protein n=1 Tax=Blepharisma stoltei TaxID=1481888 RepID=A0AAU9JRL8_9CILI|nr:unnamed protein product [Blepharisma stoltei]
MLNYIEDENYNLQIAWLVYLNIYKVLIDSYEKYLAQFKYGLISENQKLATQCAFFRLDRISLFCANLFMKTKTIKFLSTHMMCT